MSIQLFDTIEQVISTRRTVGWAKMNGQVVAEDLMKRILALADWAPTHARTEPWRLMVYTGEALVKLGKDHAQLYWEHTAEDKRLEATRERLETNVKNASHVVIAAMKRGNNDKIPVIEEIAAASAAIQNILLGATAAGVASFWSTGGMTLKPEMKTFIGLGDEDVILGMLYLGYTDEPAKEGVRNIPLEEKIIFVQP
jgi:nitroreductase